MNADDTDRVNGIGQVLIFCSVLGAVTGIMGSQRLLLGAIWIFTLALAFLDARLVTAKDRNDLAEMRMLERRWSREIERDQEALEACRIRRERRAAIRAGEIKDDGLTDWGRELATNPQLAENTKRLADRYGISAGAEEEDIFAVEARDKKVEAAWKRLVAAQEAWES